MKKCLSPARLLCLDRRFSLRLLSAVQPARFGCPSPLSSWRSRWSRQFSVDTKSRIVDRQLLEEHLRLNPKGFPVPRSKVKDPEAWISLLDQYLPPSLRRNSEDAATQSAHEALPGVTSDSLQQAIGLADLLWKARKSVNLDLLAYLGSKLNNWPAVNLLLSRLLDAAEALTEASLPLRCGFIDHWASDSGLSLDQLTDQPLSSPPQLTTQKLKFPSVPGLTTLDAFTERPIAQYHSQSLMAQVWQSLGSIILFAADASPNESKLAMSHVYRVLARLHHSGMVSERVYKYRSPDSYQATFRPPGMHLLSTHIMDILSDAAWLVHEAEVAAKAAAAGQDSPFLSVKMGIKELGHEIWLEFILWCCVEHGHIREGVWLIDQLKTRRDDMSWKFQSWKPLLRDPESLRNLKIDREVSWHQSDSVDHASLLRKRNEPPATFHGMGKRTISAEVAAALLDNLPNLVYLGVGPGGMDADSLLRHVKVAKFAIIPSTGKLLPTTKETNWFTTRVMESGRLDPETDPQTLGDFLRKLHWVAPPWSSDIYPVDEDVLTRLRPSQLYDDTSALVGLIEYNIRLFSVQRHCGSALKMFALFQAAIDTSKMQRLDGFFSSQMDYPIADIPSAHVSSLFSHKSLQSSIPQMSNTTIADLLDLVRASRAFAFGEWLLFSDDIDGPVVPPSAYGDQALAPSILRFAAATKNNSLGAAVLQSLKHPISLNTLRALINFRIAMHQWDQIVPLLEHLQGYRLKTWGHSNIADLAAEIIRLEHTLLQHLSADPVDKQAIFDTARNLSRAKDILRRIFIGEFNELTQRKRDPFEFQDRSLLAFVRLFRSVPSNSLRQVVHASQKYFRIHNKSKKTPRISRPQLYSTQAFHAILSAVVETHGSAAGKLLWDRFCLDTKSPALCRLQEGGPQRLSYTNKRDPLKGEPQFGAAHYDQARRKPITPNLNTVRIIAQAAVRELKAVSTESGAQSSVEPPSPSPDQPGIKTENLPAGAEARQILEFCYEQFELFGMRRQDICREFGGLMSWKQKEYVQKRRDEHAKKKRKKGRGRRRGAGNAPQAAPPVPAPAPSVPVLVNVSAPSSAGLVSD